MTIEEQFITNNIYCRLHPSEKLYYICLKRNCNQDQLFACQKCFKKRIHKQHTKYLFPIDLIENYTKQRPFKYGEYKARNTKASIQQQSEDIFQNLMAQQTYKIQELQDEIFLHNKNMCNNNQQNISGKKGAGKNNIIMYGHNRRVNGCLYSIIGSEYKMKKIQRALELFYNISKIEIVQSQIKRILNLKKKGQQQQQKNIASIQDQEIVQKKYIDHLAHLQKDKGIQFEVLKIKEDDESTDKELILKKPPKVQSKKIRKRKQTDEQYSQISSSQYEEDQSTKALLTSRKKAQQQNKNLSSNNELMMPNESDDEEGHNNTFNSIYSDDKKTEIRNEVQHIQLPKVNKDTFEMQYEEINGLKKKGKGDQPASESKLEVDDVYLNNGEQYSHEQMMKDLMISFENIPKKRKVKDKRQLLENQHEMRVYRFLLPKFEECGQKIPDIADIIINFLKANLLQEQMEQEDSVAKFACTLIQKYYIERYKDVSSEYSVSSLKNYFKKVMLSKLNQPVGNIKKAKNWSEEEVKYLLELRDSGIKYLDIAKKLQRPYSGVIQQINKLKKQDICKPLTPYHPPKDKQKI